MGSDHTKIVGLTKAVYFCFLTGLVFVVFVGFEIREEVSESLFERTFESKPTDTQVHYGRSGLGADP